MEYERIGFKSDHHWDITKQWWHFYVSFRQGSEVYITDSIFLDKEEGIKWVEKTTEELKTK